VTGGSNKRVSLAALIAVKPAAGGLLDGFLAGTGLDFRLFP
jgi:hypothetical protein